MGLFVPALDLAGGGSGYYGGRAGESDAKPVGAGGSGYIGGVENGTSSNGVREGNGMVKIKLIK